MERLWGWAESSADSGWPCAHGRASLREHHVSTCSRPTGSVSQSRVTSGKQRRDRHRIATATFGKAKLVRARRARVCHQRNGAVLRTLRLRRVRPRRGHVSRHSKVDELVPGLGVTSCNSISISLDSSRISESALFAKRNRGTRTLLCKNNDRGQARVRASSQGLGFGISCCTS